MPNALYWRAAVILSVPFVVLMAVVTVAFVQRHYEDVTQRMTLNLTLDIDHVLAAIPAEGLSPEAELRAEAMELTLRPLDTAPEGDQRRLFDISGSAVIDILRARYDVAAIDLSDDRRVAVALRQNGQLLEVGFSRSRVEARNPHQLLVIMLFAGLVLAFVAFNFLRIQLRPILRLADVAEAFGRGETKPFRPSGANEVRAAGQAFLDMRARLERQIEQRTLLLSGVSHDLRTPLTRLRLGLSMLPPDEDVADLIRDTEDMQRMLDAFLDFARDGMAEEMKQTDLITLVAQVVDDAARGG
ncbi:MAG: histidine kinase dimerization/phospho-acceptor domain-containing protein, partial [Shimia sp.]